MCSEKHLLFARIDKCEDMLNEKECTFLTNLFEYAINSLFKIYLVLSKSIRGYDKTIDRGLWIKLSYNIGVQLMWIRKLDAFN